MSRIILILLFTILVGCFKEKYTVSSKPQPLNQSELRFQKGDCISFKIDEVYFGAAIVLDIKKINDSIWYGLGCIDYFDSIQPTILILKEKQITGRKIENNLKTEGYNIGLDIMYVYDSCFINHPRYFNYTGRMNLRNNIEYGRIDFTDEYTYMVVTFNCNRIIRNSPPKENGSKWFNRKKNNWTNEYFNLKDFIIQ